MLPFYQTNLLHHLKHIQAWLTERGASASIALPGCILRVQYKNSYFELQPQFRSTTAEGIPTVWFELQARSTGFFGWLPYFNKHWPAARSKRVFKEFAAKHGLRTPLSGAALPDCEAVLIKTDVSSFGEGIRGPYRTGTDEISRLTLSDAEFYEQFVDGKILKATYWNGVPASAECYEHAMVVGDAKSSVAELIARRKLGIPRPVNDSIVQGILAFDRRDLKDIPAVDEKVRVDYRYGSVLFEPAFHNTNTLADLAPHTREQLDAAGQILLRAVPETIRRHTAFSADGIVDAAGDIWFLEMNCNPHLHPDVYPLILEDLFADADRIPDDLKPLHLQKNHQFGGKTAQ